MAANITAILTAIEECALGTIGTTETVPGGTLVRNAWSTDEPGAPARAFLGSRVEVEIEGPEDTGLVPRSSNVAALRYSLLVRCTFSTGFELDDDGRRSARALASSTTELVRAALTHPGNLTQTSGAVATGIVSGCLVQAKQSVKRADFKARIIVAEITAKALVQASRP